MLQQFKTKQRMLLTAVLMSGLLGAGAAQAEIDQVVQVVVGMVLLVVQVKR